MAKPGAEINTISHEALSSSLTGPFSTTSATTDFLVEKRRVYASRTILAMWSPVMKVLSDILAMPEHWLHNKSGNLTALNSIV